MNTFIIDFVDDITGLLLETWTLKKQHLTGHDFKNVRQNLYMYAAIGKEWVKLTAYVYKNSNPCFTMECKTVSDDNTVTANILVNTRYIYEKIIATKKGVSQ